MNRLPTRSGPAAVPSLGPGEVDALRELASIGCGQAVTALGKLLRRRVDLDVPEAWLGRSAGALGDFLGALGSDLVAVGVRLEGLLAGHLIVALPGPSARHLAAALGTPVEAGAWTALAESAVMESGNIVGSAFVSAIAHMVHGRLLLSVPLLARGGGRECLRQLVEGAVGELALATRFSVEGPGGLEGLVLVLPQADRLPALLAALHSYQQRA